MERKLSYEGLDVYQRTIEFIAWAMVVVEELPKRTLGDQMQRAAMSIALNIAEGAGKTRGPDRAHFYDIARGSAMECGAILDVALAMKITRSETRAAGKDHLVAIVAMLTRLSQSAR